MAFQDAILRLEALAAFVAGSLVWVTNDGSLIWLVLLLLVPDLSMVGYLANNRIGALTYNLVHNWVLAAAALGAGWWVDRHLMLLAGAVMLAHVGMARALGYGLKLSGDFRDTHLGRIGRGHPYRHQPMSQIAKP